MLDSRFETAADDAKHLLSAMDIDELDELATFLMVLFMRPVVVEEVRDIEADAPGLEIILGGNEHSVGTTYHFPVSVLELVQGSAETANDLGPYDDGSEQEEPQDLSALQHGPLIEALQRALGHVRLISMLGHG